MFFFKQFVLSFVFLGCIFLPVVTKATSITLAPAHISVTEGDTFSVAVKVNALANPAYTVKVETSFTPGMLRFSNWEFENAWIPLHQKEYESFDSTQGTLVRTAGYPSGFTGSAGFGTVIFRALQAGEAKISVNEDSFIYNKRSENTFTGGNTVLVTILPLADGEKKLLTTDTVEHSFDMTLELPKSEFSAGDPIAAFVYLKNLSDRLEKLQVPVHYSIMNSSGDIVFEEDTVIALDSLKTQLDYQPSVHDLPAGTYTLLARVDYPNLVSPVQVKSTFTITKQISETAKQQPTLFDVSAEVLTQKYTKTVTPYMIAILCISIFWGVVLVMVLDRFRRRRILYRKKSHTHKHE